MTIQEYLVTNRTRRSSPCTVSDLALMLGVSRQAVYNWMGGKCRPRFDNIVEIVRLSNGMVTHLSSATAADSKTHHMFCLAWRNIVGAVLPEVTHV